jgi:hypothetical protein
MFESMTDLVNFESMTDVLPKAGYGWLGVFIVTIVLVLAVSLLSKIGGKKQ